MYPLPPYARQIEFLESTGTQWIDTELEYFPEFEIGAAVPGGVGNNTLGIGQAWKLGRDSATTPVWRVTLNNRSIKSSVPCATYADMSYHGTTVKVNANTLEVPANQYVTGTMILFSTGEAIPTAYPLKLYYCRLFDWNGNLVRSFVPCRILGVGYLWDEVEGKFYGNNGTGDFVLGHDIREGVMPTRLNPFGIGRRMEEIRQVEYLESTGTQYVDTGIVPTQTTKIRFAYLLTQTPTDSFAAAFGCMGATGGATTSENAYSGFTLFNNPTVPIQARVGRSTAANIVSDVSVAANVRYDGELQFGQMRLNGTEYTQSGSSSWITMVRSICTHTANDQTSTFSRRFVCARFYSFSIYDGATLVRDFIPVRIGTTGYLLDKISNKLYSNAGTGDFVCGGDL